LFVAISALKIKEKRVREEEHRAEKDRQILAQPAPSSGGSDLTASSSAPTTSASATGDKATASK
jgi:hypothetical protein